MSSAAAGNDERERLASGPAVVVNPTTVYDRVDSPWAPNTPAAVSVTGIVGVTVLEGIALSHGVDGNHFYAALGIIAAICGIHARFAPLLTGSRR